MLYVNLVLCLVLSHTIQFLSAGYIRPHIHFCANNSNDVTVERSCLRTHVGVLECQAGDTHGCSL